MPKPNKYANSDSFFLISEESQSDEDSPQKPTILHTTFNYNFKTPFSNNSSPIKLHDNSSFKTIIKNPSN